VNWISWDEEMDIAGDVYIYITLYKKYPTIVVTYSGRKTGILKCTGIFMYDVFNVYFKAYFNVYVKAYSNAYFKA